MLHNLDKSDRIFDIVLLLALMFILLSGLFIPRFFPEPQPTRVQWTRPK